MNVLTVTGRLTSGPIRRDTTRGVVCEFRLAVDHNPRVWITVQTWGQLAGRCAQHLHSGRRVALSGPLQCDSYERDGTRQVRWYVKAHTVNFLDPPNHQAAEDVGERFGR